MGAEIAAMDSEREGAVHQCNGASLVRDDFRGMPTALAFARNPGSEQRRRQQRQLVPWAEMCFDGDGVASGTIQQSISPEAHIREG